MKINEKTHFPHPVLSNHTQDYSSGAFSLVVTGVTETFVSDQVTLEYSVTLTEDGLKSAVANGHAAVGIFVICLDTYFSRLVTLGLDGGRFSFDPGMLVGRVEIRPLIWAVGSIPTECFAHCHQEFEGAIPKLDTGTVLAIGDIQIINVGREKLAQMDTIFSIVEDANLQDDCLSVNLESERIQILVASNMHQEINTLRGKPFGRAIVLNGVYLPAVMEVLDALRAADSSYEGRRWYRVFKAKCDHLTVNLQESELWRDAQKLLRNPFSEIRHEKTFWGE